MMQSGVKFRTMLPLVICLADIMVISVSCQRNFQSEINDFLKTEIDFHGYYARIFGGNIDTLFLSHEPNTMVFWFDSTECSFCEANKLQRLDELYDMASHYNFSIMTIISPFMSLEKESIERLSLYDLAHPVYIDMANKFKRINKTIPNYKVCHSFFVGSSNQPIFIGDPLNNSKLMRLFKSCIEKGYDEKCCVK